MIRILVFLIGAVTLTAIDQALTIDGVARPSLALAWAASIAAAGRPGPSLLAAATVGLLRGGADPAAPLLPLLSACAWSCWWWCQPDRWRPQRGWLAVASWALGCAVLEALAERALGARSHGLWTSSSAIAGTIAAAIALRWLLGGLPSWLCPLSGSESGEGLFTRRRRGNPLRGED